MKPSLAVRFRALASKIHPPLPLNPRESQKLLNVLTETFREQLDREHSEANPTRPRAVDAHFQSILSSPLFSKKQARDGLTILGELQGSLISPMDYFSRKVASGQASIDIAKRCLKVELQNATMFGEAVTTSSIKDTQIASSVLHWLWSSGSEESMLFVFDKVFIELLMPFIVRAGKQTHVWQWFQRLQMMAQSAGHYDLKLGQQYPHTMGYLLTALLKTEVQSTSTFDTAISSLLEASQRLANLTLRFQKKGKALIGPTNWLCDQLRRRPGTTIDVVQYDKLIDSLRLHNSSKLEYVVAELYLRHPSRPDPHLALDCIRGRSWNYILTQASTRRRQELIWFCLDTAGLLLADGKDGEARWIMQFVQSNFAKDMEQSSGKRTGEPVLDVGMAMESLEGLAMH